MPAVTAIANAPQNSVRSAPFATGAPPVRAATAPSSARKTSDAELTLQLDRRLRHEQVDDQSGNAPPAAKLAADASAACTGRAALISEMPSSSRACAASASFAVS